MRKIKNWIKNKIKSWKDGLKEWLKRSWKIIKKTRFFLGIVCLAIGISGAVCYYEGKDLYSDYQEAMKIWEDYNTRHGLKSAEELEAYSEADEQVSQDGNGVSETPSIPIKEMSVEDEIRTIAKREKFKDADLLVRIASCESGLIPRRDSDVKTSSAKGLFQILNMHGLTAEERYDTDTSTTWAINKIKAGGLNAWNASKHCWNI